MSPNNPEFAKLLNNVRRCELCQNSQRIVNLPYPPKPIIQMSISSKILIIGQAPGEEAHHKNQPFDDASGARLRNWLGLSDSAFYQSDNIAVMPMGFCYPGKNTTGDAPPSVLCAPQWHKTLLSYLNPQLTLYVGRYAQQYYFPTYSTLTSAIQAENSQNNGHMILPHPSGRNNRWLSKHAWFTSQTLPLLKARVRKAIANH